MSASVADHPTVLILASTFPRWKGDPEPGFVHELAKRLTTQFNIIVLCPHAPGAQLNEWMDGVEVIRYRYAPSRLETLVNDGGIVTNLKNRPLKLLLVPGFVLMQAWRAWRLCRTRKIDAIHAHWLIPQGLIAALLLALSGGRVRFLVTSHGADLYALRGRALEIVKRFVLRKATVASVVSSAMQETVAQLGADMSKVVVQPMGVDMNLRFVPKPEQVRSSTELLFVGRLVEKKGLRHLLDALPAVLQERPEVTLSIAGFGPEETALKAQVNSLHLDTNVRFLGAVSQEQLPALYQRAALFVAPFIKAKSGDEEGLGLVLVEALACGCPVLVGDVASMRDIFESMADESIVDPRDSVRFATAILMHLKNHESGVKRALVMRETLASKLSWDHVSKQYSELLQRVVPHADSKK